ncbi:Zn(2+) transporter ZRT3 [Aspergillus candidus]|uniref:Zinc/iron permease n=1 Tax=Aspergillus candidus TaxID=41067 RepID=A0A2I2FBX7_ASPCN|nr:hypothetical protein BDW47DRAFT_29138 [Aspergillus candidus]PLB38132.1 hypothetical protein BDW47DRAFT_29138 [Aspergillus candidus]
MRNHSTTACVLGASLVCADVLLRRFSHQKNFQIVNNNGFLSASLCLSAGVLLFTSLYSMLPTSNKYLIRAGFSPSAAAFFLIGLFLAGVVIIRVLSAFLHKYIPSHVVDCDHTHEPHANEDPGHGHGHHPHPHPHTHHSSEHTPLLAPAHKSTTGVVAPPHAHEEMPSRAFRQEPWRMRLVKQVRGLVGGVKAHCDEDGPCYGFSQACGHECAKTILDPTADVENGRPSVIHSRSLPARPVAAPLDAHNAEIPALTWVPPEPSSSASSHIGLDGTADPDLAAKSTGPATAQHHHHVPQNAFLSIGLQTSIAIALHKLPEGFITYATNHASPQLGATVFLALFIHNISEGFAMALPLYLALQSRGKAMFWSSLLGGISQPAGAGLAALWIWTTQRAAPGESAPDPSWGVYGGMFAATAGVMTSVGLQLFSEGLGLTHHGGMCIGFAIGGMGLMGLSFALTA